MRELRELYLPKLVEARDRVANPPFRSETEWQPSTPLHLSQSSLSTDQTPVSPTFSVRSQPKLLSPTSSLASSPVMRSSLEDYSPKRPLTEVREEPHQEKDDEFEMVDALPRDSKCMCLTSVIGNLSRTRRANCIQVRRPKISKRCPLQSISKRIRRLSPIMTGSTRHHSRQANSTSRVTNDIAPTSHHHPTRYSRASVCAFPVCRVSGAAGRTSGSRRCPTVSASRR